MGPKDSRGWVTYVSMRDQRQLDMRDYKVIVSSLRSSSNGSWCSSLLRAQALNGLDVIQLLRALQLRPIFDLAGT